MSEDFVIFPAYVVVGAVPRCSVLSALGSVPVATAVIAPTGASPEQLLFAVPVFFLSWISSVKF